MAKRTGPKLALNEKKLKALFPAMMIAPQNRYIAYALGISKVETIKQWYANGKVLLEQFEDKLEELDDIFSFEYEEVFEYHKVEFDAKFRMIYDLDPEDIIQDRLRLEYNNFMLNEKRKFIEDKISKRENDILDKVQLSDNEDIDKEFKLYIRFARIYDRARAVKEIGYLSNIDRHAGTSKNVGLSLKLLERMNTEDFGEKQQIQHSGTVEVNNKSILSLALQNERQIRQALEAKKERVIDVAPIPQIEEKSISLVKPEQIIEQKDGI